MVAVQARVLGEDLGGSGGRVAPRLRAVLREQGLHHAACNGWAGPSQSILKRPGSAGPPMRSSGAASVDSPRYGAGLAGRHRARATHARDGPTACAVLCSVRCVEAGHVLL